jgi:integrase/recombinase XerC
VRSREDFIADINTWRIDVLDLRKRGIFLITQEKSLYTLISELDIRQPLFIALDRCSRGHRLTGSAIHKLVAKIAAAAGVNKKMSPHRVRHSGITAALDATGGDVRRVQKLSRHVDLNTLMIYDDNRKNVQGEISDLLAGLV